MGRPGDAPLIRACWLSWLAVATADRAEVVRLLGLGDVREIGWAEGVDLVDEVAHDAEHRFFTVVVTPPMRGWTLVVGRAFGLPYPAQVAGITDLCGELSARFGRAQAYFHSEQNDGEAWLIAERGQVLRRWISEYPELAMGEPFGAERRLLDAYGIAGKPEDLDLEDDLAQEWGSAWGDCWATTVAAESGIDPTSTPADAGPATSMLLAVAPDLAA